MTIAATRGLARTTRPRRALRPRVPRCRIPRWEIRTRAGSRRTASELSAGSPSRRGAPLTRRQPLAYWWDAANFHASHASARPTFLVAGSARGHGDAVGPDAGQDRLRADTGRADAVSDAFRGRAGSRLDRRAAGRPHHHAAVCRARLLHLARERRL